MFVTILTIFESLNACFSPVFRMKAAVFLSLLITLSHGLNNVSFSNGQPEMFADIFPNWAHPCQRSLNNNAYNQFKRRHVLLRDFDTRRTSAWVDYLTTMNLCGRTRLQSFLRKNENDSIIRICNGRGVRRGHNLCTSQRRFTVYTVESALRNGRCEVQFQTERSYVIVACEVIGNRCLPVHYERQTNTAPPRDGRTCRPR